MKVLFDTCIVVDILGKSKFFEEAFVAYDVALFKKMDVCLSTSSTTDIVYLLHSRGFMNNADARSVVGALLDEFEIIDNTATDVKRAHLSEMKDYEDALIAYAALRNGVDFIITRNSKDFAASPVPAISPDKFIELYKPSCLTYEGTF
jgi:predicted nucleic acid-binding protein